MTTTATTTCPDWCQSKPHDDNPDGGFDGPHTWPSIPALDGDDEEFDPAYDNTTLISVDYIDGAEHRSVINLIASNLSLTPKQARSVALALLTVADWAEGNEATA
jgi:hypothetical protein